MQDQIIHGETILEVRGLTKIYPGGVVALDHVDLEFKAGEIHAILGENGAGKTTLMNILYGVLQPDEGEIYIRGKRVRFRSPLDAINMGIGMVHQQRRLIFAHTVLENIILGHPKAGRILDYKKIRREIEDLCRKYNFKIDLDARVWQLSAGEQQLVEIIRALYRGAKILILDEPTSVLTPIEAEAFLNALKSMSKGEIALVPFVTHKLPEVFAVSNRVTILRRGKVVKRIETKDATMTALAEYMVGREVLFTLTKPKVPIGGEILRVENLSALNDKGLPAIKNVSFSIREGEILGIAGVSGNGQQELAEVLAGLRKAETGRIIFMGKDITNASVLERIKMGIGYIPSERLGVGVIGSFSLMENILMNLYFDKEFVNHGFINYKKIREYAEKIISEFEVVAPSVNTKAAHLSGGNLQRLVLARVIPRTSKLLIANLPTTGLDVAATESVRMRLLDCKKKGMGILLISDDLDEVLQISDTIAPIYEGRFIKILPAEEAKKEVIGAMMTGAYSEGM